MLKKVRIEIIAWLLRICKRMDLFSQILGAVNDEHGKQFYLDI